MNVSRCSHHQKRVERSIISHFRPDRGWCLKPSLKEIGHWKIKHTYIQKDGFLMVIFILWDRIRTKSPEKTNISHFETHPMSIWETPLKTTHECPIILTSQNHQCRSFPAICTLKNHAMFPIASKANWGSSAKSSLACRDSPPFLNLVGGFNPKIWVTLDHLQFVVVKNRKYKKHHQLDDDV